MSRRGPFAAGGSSTFTTTVNATAFSVGSTPASTGAVRLSNHTYMYGRNASNSGDVRMLGVDASSRVVLGDATATAPTSYLIVGTDVTGLVAGEFAVATGSGQPITFTSQGSGQISLKVGSTEYVRVTTGAIDLRNHTTSASAGSGGAASIPLTCQGFITIKVDGTDYKVPYFPTA